MVRNARLIRSWQLALLLVTAMLVACGGAPTSEESEATGAEGTGDAASAPASTASSTGTADASVDPLQAIYSEVEGLDWEARRAALVELAAEEEGDLVVYGTAAQSLLERLVQEFTELTGVGATLYRAPIPTMLQRLTEEKAAGGVRADVLLANDPEITTLSREGYFLPLETPAKEQINQDYVHDDRAGFAILYYAAGWNTNAVTPDEVPTTWEDALAYDGRLIMEQNSYDWFATLVQEYFIGELGMTEEEAVQLFRDAADGALVGAGKTTILQSVLSGEVDLAPSLFMHSIVSESAAGAPVDWQPPIQPMPGRSNDVAILTEVVRPAKALLFADFMLTEAQESIADENYPPATTEPVANLDVDLSQFETIPMDIEMLVDEREYWEDMYLEIVSGGQMMEAPAGG